MKLVGELNEMNNPFFITIALKRYV